jgi:hypothetical protein
MCTLELEPGTKPAYSTYQEGCRSVLETFGPQHGHHIRGVKHKWPLQPMNQMTRRIPKQYLGAHHVISTAAKL